MKDCQKLRTDVDTIIKQLVDDINPYDKTKQCVESLVFNDGKKILISIGKAAWTMAKAVSDLVDIDEGAVITKYNHSLGEINKVKVFEAGHPIVDENSIKATEYVLNITNNLKENDEVILCISGGGSALFEKPLIDLEQLQDINNQLIKSGASINEINTIRKRLSSVKAGRFALHCNKAHISCIILSDVIGNDLSTIASGPAAVDFSSIEDGMNIINKYNIKISDEIKKLLLQDTIKKLDNADSHIVGSVEQLCIHTSNVCEKLGYEPIIIQNDCTDNVIDICDKFNQLYKQDKHNVAYIIGGESVVEVKGNGLGGRNTELALLCSQFIDKENVCIFTFGSDGTDGPTDAAGGYVDINTKNIIDVKGYLENNDSYHALEKINGLLKTGPTGSNVNDVYVMLVR